MALLHRDDGELGQDDGPVNGSGYRPGALNTQIRTSMVVPNGNKHLEPGPLASMGLLLHGHTLQNLDLEGHQEKINDLRFLDGQEKREISFKDLIFMSLTRRLSLVMGTQLLVLHLASVSSMALAPDAAGISSTKTPWPPIPGPPGPPGPLTAPESSAM